MFTMYNMETESPHANKRKQDALGFSEVDEVFPSREFNSVRILCFLYSYGSIILTKLFAAVIIDLVLDHNHTMIAFVVLVNTNTQIVLNFKVNNFNIYYKNSYFNYFCNLFIQLAFGNF